MSENRGRALSRPLSFCAGDGVAMRCARYNAFAIRHEGPMNEALISACQLFLIPATLLFGALGVANTRGLKFLVCVLGVATTGLLLYRVWYWTGLSLIDRRTALGLAGLFAGAWVITLLVQLKNMFSPRYGDRR
jgi:hypothetical protein